MKDYKLTKADKTVLKKYETHLKRALDGYVRGIYESDIIQLSSIYNKYGEQLENKHCPTCVLGMIRFLANKYYE